MVFRSGTLEKPIDMKSLREMVNVELMKNSQERSGSIAIFSTLELISNTDQGRAQGVAAATPLRDKPVFFIIENFKIIIKILNTLINII